MKWTPEQQYVRMGHAAVTAVDSGRADLDFGDGTSMADVPVYGNAPFVGQRVLVLMQGRGAMALVI